MYTRHLLLMTSVLFIHVLDIFFAKEMCLGNETTTVVGNLRPAVNPRRRKRSLTFPKGSNFVLTITLLKAIQVLDPTNWNLDLEFDMIWPIPPGVQGRKSMKPMRRPIPPHRRQRRELYANFEAALDSQGLPGNQCILRTVCEVKFILNPPGISLVEDILRVIFSYPRGSAFTYDAYDHAYLKDKDCDVIYSCPFSVLNLLLHYHNNVSKYK